MIHYRELAPDGAPAVSEMPDMPLPTRRRVARVVVSILTSILCLAGLAASSGAQAAAPPPTGPAAPARNLNWLGDKRAFSVGDILKVSVDEYTAASANKGNTADASRRRTMDIDIAPPSVGTTAMEPIDGSITTGDAGQSRQRGQATNSTRYVGELPVRVVAITKEGLLQVRGTKLVNVDKNKQEMTLTGFVRPQDVNSQDMVLSSSIADVQLAYQSKGGLGKPRNGIVSKLLGLFWP